MRMSERLPAIAENLTDSLLPNLFQLLGADPSTSWHKQMVSLVKME
jgi:hypothetical protein